jgi:two-component system, LuxR family, sensor kinase FixL
VAQKGVLLYANDASGSLLVEWNCRVNQIVPEHWQKIVSEVFASGSAQRIEMEHAGRVLAFMTVPVCDAGYVNLYGRDVSTRKRIEKALQQAHNRLAVRVQERTAELSKANEQLREAVEELEQKEKILRK